MSEIKITECELCSGHNERLTLLQFGLFPDCEHIVLLGIGSPSLCCSQDQEKSLLASFVSDPLYFDGHFSLGTKSSQIEKFMAAKCKFPLKFCSERAFKLCMRGKGLP